jgi:ABC-type amino acid transport substrate-binding protein
VTLPQRPIESAEALRAARLGIIRGTSWATAALSAGVSVDNLVYLDSTPALVAALKKGQIASIVMSAMDFEALRANEPGLHAGMFVGPKTSLCWGVRKEDELLRAALDDHLDAAKRSGAWTQLVRRYFHSDVLALLARMRQE